MSKKDHSFGFFTFWVLISLIVTFGGLMYNASNGALNEPGPKADTLYMELKTYPDSVTFNCVRCGQENTRYIYDDQR